MFKFIIFTLFLTLIFFIVYHFSTSLLKKKYTFLQHWSIDFHVLLNWYSILDNTLFKLLKLSNLSGLEYTKNIGNKYSFSSFFQLKVVDSMILPILEDLTNFKICQGGLPLSKQVTITTTLIADIISPSWYPCHYIYT